MTLLLRAGLLAACTALLVTGCASMGGRGPANRTGSTVEFLYPAAKEPPRMTPAPVTLRPPVRVGLAFVPGTGFGGDLPAAEKQRLLERVRAAFREADYIGAIEVIPDAYLRPRGGFENLEQVGRMFNVELVALVSYDQVQFNDASALSFLYWTIIGAYVIRGDRYDVQTMVDAAVVDIASRRLLFRAPGTSQVKGSAAMVGFNEASREARTAGFEQAIAQLIPALQREIAGYRERIRSDASVRVEARPGYGGGGAFGGHGAALLLAVLATLAGVRRRRAGGARRAS